MQVLSESLCQAIGECLDHDVVVVIAIIMELLTELLLPEACRTSKATNVVLNSTVFRSDEVRHGNEAFLVQVELLA